jgi:Flp pilus assembly protein TadG
MGPQMTNFVRRLRDGRRTERGFFMVWMALTLVTLTAFAGLGLEYSRWNNLATRIQKAADAAALAGTIFMPENIANKAFLTAKDISKKNGFEDGVGGVAIATVAGRLPNQLKVSISVPTHNPWAQLVNYNSTTITRSAVAEYQLPQNLGSPANTYGNDPESAVTPQPQFWGNVFGPSSFKDKGDAIQAAGPNANASLCNADNCPGGVNKDYDPNGYFYGIDVPVGATGALNVEVFDPAFVHVGDNCSDTDAVNSLNSAATLTGAQIPGYTGTVTPAVRYASGSGSAFCTGDMSYAGDANNNANPWTVWTLRAPDSSSWDPTNNPIVCQAEFPGVYPERSNDQPTGAVDDQHLKALLQQATPYPGTNPSRTFASFFREWVQICSVTNPVQGTYFLQVQTAYKISGAATSNGGGANRFALRAGLGTNFSTTNGLRIYGNQKMGVYMNATGADTRFYLTRILPGEAGKTLVLNFFDVGDGGGPATITVLPPPDSNVTAGAFAGCTYTAPPGNAVGPPWGTVTNTSPGCQVAVNHAAFNGQWVTFVVPIPDTYTCTATDNLGCWTRLRFTYPNGTSVQDTTTWSAYILGDPVRLIQ